MSERRPTTTCPRCEFRWQRRATRREMRLRRALEWLARELANDWQRRATRREMRLRRALEWLARELANDRQRRDAQRRQRTEEYEAMASIGGEGA